jgi:hypothetical protein
VTYEEPYELPYSYLYNLHAVCRNLEIVWISPVIKMWTSKIYQTKVLCRLQWPPNRKVLLTPILLHSCIGCLIEGEEPIQEKLSTPPFQHFEVSNAHPV